MCTLMLFVLNNFTLSILSSHELFICLVHVFPTTSTVGGGGGGLLGTAGTAMGAAALGTALLNPVSCLWGKHSFHDELIV